MGSDWPIGVTLTKVCNALSDWSSVRSECKMAKCQREQPQAAKSSLVVWLKRAREGKQSCMTMYLISEGSVAVVETPKL